MSAQGPEPVQVDVDSLLGGHAVEAGVAALAARNQHHLAGMDEQEREQAVGHWRELTVEVLNAARVALAGPESQVEGGGRAGVVFEDAGGDDVNVHVTFAPQLEELPDGAIAGTPAQLAAVSFLESLAGDDEHEH
ncbi:MAG: hypothetical protein HZB46_18170 [Solirubrobacterales bacterium]|nr:hypothetical protein [Solirubrobacterales bacterium]